MYDSKSIFPPFYAPKVFFISRTFLQEMVNFSLGHGPLQGHGSRTRRGTVWQDPQSLCATQCMDLRRWALVPVGGVFFIIGCRTRFMRTSKCVFFGGFCSVVIWDREIVQRVVSARIIPGNDRWDVYNLNIEPYIFSKTCSLRPALQVS